MVVGGRAKENSGGTYTERESIVMCTYAASRDLAKYPNKISERPVNVV